MKISSRANRIARAVTAAVAFGPGCRAEERCCLRSKGQEDPCNPDKWTCWPMDRITRFGECGRRDSSDCKYDVEGAVRESCCWDPSDCYVPAGEDDTLPESCYLDNFGFSGDISTDHSYCTEDYFWIDGYVPAQGFEGTVCGNDGFGGLDPHFQTWNGDWYDYMGVCDLVFLHAPDFGSGLGLDIHIRTKERGAKADPYKYTFIESVALAIGTEAGNKDNLQVHSWGEYTLNGDPNPKLPATLGRFPITHHVDDETKKRERFIVTLGRKERVVISVFKDLVSVTLKGATHKSFGTSKGLMGAFGSGAKLARNNTAFIIHGDEDDVEFAEDWQVRDTDAQLFAVAREPQYPQKCRHGRHSGNADNTLKAKFHRHLRESTVSEKAARIACAHVKNKESCINDVLRMDDLDLADEFPLDL